MFVVSLCVSATSVLVILYHLRFLGIGGLLHRFQPGWKLIVHGDVCGGSGLSSGCTGLLPQTKSDPAAWSCLRFIILADHIDCRDDHCNVDGFPSK